MPPTTRLTKANHKSNRPSSSPKTISLDTSLDLSDLSMPPTPAETNKHCRNVGRKSPQSSPGPITSQQPSRPLPGNYDTAASLKIYYKSDSTQTMSKLLELPQEEISQQSKTAPTYYQDGSVRLTLFNITDAKKLKAYLEGKNFQAYLTTKNLPRIKVLNVPGSINNQTIAETADGMFLSAFPTGITRTVILAVPPTKYRTLLNDKFIPITSLVKLRVVPHDAPPQCNHCWEYGHGAQKCRNLPPSNPRCGHCSQLGHSRNQCPNPNSLPICHNCQIVGSDPYHSVSSRNCPEYALAMERRLASTAFTNN